MKKYCGSYVQMGHGESAKCGTPYYSVIAYQCPQCVAKSYQQQIDLAVMQLNLLMEGQTNNGTPILASELQQVIETLKDDA